MMYSEYKKMKMFLNRLVQISQTFPSSRKSDVVDLRTCISAADFREVMRLKKSIFAGCRPVDIY